ncbi:MAG: hypothetical protein HYY02_07765 [Chloroflexi bacterium]|nr:hypothetical protein [Chloroflexota bacterium]
MSYLPRITPLFNGLALLLFLAPVAGGAACAAQQGMEQYRDDKTRDTYTAAPAGQEGPYLSNLPIQTAAMYRYAMERQDTLRYIPCFCGCVGQEHSSNASCYLKADPGDKRTHFNHHAAG